MRPLLFTLLLAALLRTSAASQEPDPRRLSLESIVDAALAVPVQHSRAVSAAAVGSGEGEKCGLWISLAVAQNWDKFTEAQRRELRPFLDAPATQKQRVIGHFRIHYDTTGANAAAMLGAGNLPIPNTAEEYVDSVGMFFNDVFSREIDSLGYASPLQPGQAAYDIYVSDISYYGLTQSESIIGGFVPTRYVTSIVIDNDFRQFYSRGMAGLKVTAAHEFHHAIQMGSYGVWTSDPYFMEITSTWMEDVMYNDVNDYYQYIKDPTAPPPAAPRGQFSTPELSFTATNGLIEYSRAVWGKFIEERYSADVMRRTWEEIRQVPALTALDRALAERQSSLRQAFLEWTVWNYHTGALADPVASYVEGGNYPKIRYRPSTDYMSPGRTLQDSIQAYSSVYWPINVGGNVMMAMLSNVNPGLPPGWLHFSYLMQDDGGNGSFKHLANGISVRIEAPDLENWSSQETVPSRVADVLAYPNPFVQGKDRTLIMRLPHVEDKNASLIVMNSSMERIFSGERPIFEVKPLEQAITWFAEDDDGHPVPSGIYIFVVRVDGKDYKGKIAVIGG